MQSQPSQPIFRTRSGVLATRAEYEKKYKRSYSDLLSIVIFTSINIVLLLTNLHKKLSGKPESFSFLLF